MATLRLVCAVAVLTLSGPASAFIPTWIAVREAVRSSQTIFLGRAVQTRELARGANGIVTGEVTFAVRECFLGENCAGARTVLLKYTIDSRFEFDAPAVFAVGFEYFVALRSTASRGRPLILDSRWGAATGKDDLPGPDVAYLASPIDAAGDPVSYMFQRTKMCGRDSETRSLVEIRAYVKERPASPPRR